MPRSPSPRVLITLGWLLLVPVGCVVLTCDGTVRETWDDVQIEKETAKIERETAPPDALTVLMTQARQRPLTAGEQDDFRRLVPEQAERFARGAMRLRRLPQRAKDAGWMQDLIARYEHDAKTYRDLAERLEHSPSPKR